MYENKQQMVSAEWKKPVHMPPHLHEAIEIVYVTEGCIELGVGQELYHMEKGNFAIVFPDVVNAIRFLMNKNGQSQLLMKAYVAKNYSSRITLEKMVNDLGVSKYVLSRMFAKTFHCNFIKKRDGYAEQMRIKRAFPGSFRHKCA